MINIPITPQNLVRHELIGLELEVKESPNSSQIGLKGRVIDETFKIIKIDSKRGEKAIPKEKTTFIFTIPDGTRVQVDGNLLLGRPEDRIKKKLPKW
jgi:ribonuclease P protein subunit POP4